MSCIVVLTAKIIKHEGANPITCSFAVPMETYAEKEIYFSSHEKITLDPNFSPEFVHRIFNHQKLFHGVFIDELRSLPHDEMFKKVKEYNNISDCNDYTLAHWLAHDGIVFSVEEILELGNPINNHNQSIAHLMAWNYHIFTIDELERLNDFKDNYGHSIANVMVDRGHKFSINDLKKLLNYADDHNHSICHHMATLGYIFSQDEIEELGNPSDDYGEKLFDFVFRTEKYKYNQQNVD